MRHEFNTNRFIDRWLLRFWRVQHYFLGPIRGCSCSRCFNHEWRRVRSIEVSEIRVRIAKLEEEVRQLRRNQ